MKIKLNKKNSIDQTEDDLYVDPDTFPEKSKKLTEEAEELEKIDDLLEIEEEIEEELEEELEENIEEEIDIEKEEKKELKSGDFVEYLYHDGSFTGKIIDVIDVGQVETILHGIKFKYDCCANPVAIIKMYAKSKSKDLYTESDVELCAIPMGRLSKIDTPDEKSIISKDDLEMDKNDVDIEGLESDLIDALEGIQSIEEIGEIDEDENETDDMNEKGLSISDREKMLQKQFYSLCEKSHELEKMKEQEKKSKKARYF